jgi:hypothetical protein
VRGVPGTVPLRCGRMTIALSEETKLTEPPLIIDADAVLTAPVGVQSFEPIARRNSQILKLLGHTQALRPRTRP